MANRRFLFLLFALFVFSASAFPQETSYRLEETEGGSLFVQHLEWESTEYASRYEVVLEQKKISTYTQVMRRIVEAPFLDISIPAGEYRYKISSFNVLGRLDAESEWVYFSVIPALQPVIFSYDPENFYFDRPSLRIIRLEGVNLTMESEIYLLRRNEDPQAEPEKIVPREVRRTELGESAQLVFYEEDLLAGVYDILVFNPGGLETAAGPFGISVAKPYDINLSAGYAPLIKLYGPAPRLIDSAFIPLGFSARASFVPFKRDTGFFGAEADLSWNYLYTQDDNFITRASFVNFHINALYQYWYIKNILAFNARLGLGLSGVLNYYFEFVDTGKTWDPMSSAFFSVGLGASVQWLFYGQLYAEAGFDYFHAAAKAMPMGFLRFTLSMGWQL
ncbi:MAG: hypothetical protein LBS48_06440 [Treponema sp.]|jgi:hypothetical protein|nr:hypothetical protein [Treponema sp.]